MIELARKIASKSPHTKFFHAAIVLKGGAVMATATNFNWNHAERSALGKVSPDRRDNLKMWSVRISKTGALANAKPCSRCEEYMRANGVRLVFYSDAEGDIQKLEL